MLIVRRRAGEGILIDGKVEIVVAEIAAGRVKLGIRAPENVTIERTETDEAARRNRLASSLIPAVGTQGAADLIKTFRGDRKDEKRGGK